MKTLADTIPTTPGLAEMVISKNRIGADGASALLDAIPNSGIKTLTIGKDIQIDIGVTSDETWLDYSNQNLGPGELMLISALVIPTTPGVVEVNLSQNKMISSDDLIKVEADVPRLSALCQSEAKILVDKERLEKLNLANYDLGPDDISFIATEFIPTIPGVVEVVISGNKCFGAIHHLTSHGDACFDHGTHDIDKDQSGWTALCKTIKGTTDTETGHRRQRNRNRWHEDIGRDHPYHPGAGRGGHLT